MLERAINIIFLIVVVNFLLVLSIVLKILKKGPEIVFYTSGFLVPAIFMLIVIGTFFFGNGQKKKKWIVILINVVSILIAFGYLQKTLMVR